MTQQPVSPPNYQRHRRALSSPEKNDAQDAIPRRRTLSLHELTWIAPPSPAAASLSTEVSGDSPAPPQNGGIPCPPPPPPVYSGGNSRKTKGGRIITTMWSCGICLEDFNYPKRPVKCNGGHTFCRSCLEKYIEVCLRTPGVVGFKCPMSFACGTEFPVSVASKMFPQGRVEEVLANATLKDAKSDDWVFRCENATCPGVLRAPASSSMPSFLQCNSCSQSLLLGPQDEEFYLKLRNQPGMTLEERLDAFYFARKTKQCPYCHKVIERVEGCPHMTCVCGKEFCWNCGGKYKKGSPWFLGSHYHRLAVNGCPHLLFPNNEAACKAARGALFVGKVTALVTLGPPLLVGGAVFVGIPFGIYRGCRAIYRRR